MLTPVPFGIIVFLRIGNQVSRETIDMTPREQGEKAAQDWIAASDSAWDAEQPRNPFPRPSTPDQWREVTDYSRWNRGFDVVVYMAYGDRDADMAKAEKAFGC